MNLKKFALSVLTTAALSTSLVACSTSPVSLTTDSTPAPTPSHSSSSPSPKATHTKAPKATKAPKDQTTTANVPTTEPVAAPAIQPVQPVPEPINPPVHPAPVIPAAPVAPAGPPANAVTDQHVQSETVQDQKVIESQNTQTTNEDTATTEAEYLEAIFDENQSTHWENGGLVVGTLGDALAMCGDPRFGPESEFGQCVDASNEWAKDTGLDTTKVGPTTLPPAPAPVK